MGFRIHARPLDADPPQDETAYLDIFDTETNRPIATLVFGPHTPTWLRTAAEQLPFFLSLLKRT